MVEGSRKLVRYAITDLAPHLAACELDAAEQRRMRLREALLRWSTEQIDFVQLREKALGAGEVFALAQTAMNLLRALGQGPTQRPKLLLNGRPDLAAAARADGVHLTGRPGELTPTQARGVFRATGLASCLVSVSCHTLEDVRAAREGGADLILFGPVFGKTVRGRTVSEAVGLHALAEAVEVAGHVKVLALGGVTEATTEACLQTRAVGVAGIRLFQ